MKTLRGTPKHLGQDGQLEGLVYLMLTVPFKCNYRCLKCFNLSENRPLTSGDPISADEIASKVDEAAELGARVVVIAGEGEPTLDPDIYQIIRQVDSKGMIPIVYTNGYPLTESVIDFFRQANACLVVAMDSMNPAVYRSLTGGPQEALSVVLENLALLRRAYEDTIDERDGVRIVRLALNMTICSLNEGETASIRDFAGEDMYFICNPLARYGNAEANWDALIENDNAWNRHHQLAEANSESGGPLTLNREGLCGYSVNGIGIGPYGHYMTCAYTSKTNGLLGTIWDRSLRDAYAFKTALERHHYAKYGHVPCLVRATTFSTYLGSLSQEATRPMAESFNASTSTKTVSSIGA